MKRLIYLVSALIAVACTTNQGPEPIDKIYNRPTSRAVKITLEAMDELFQSHHYV